MIVSISPRGIDFICQPRFDSFVAKPYRDSGGLWTIGFGSRITDKQVEEMKDGITIEKAKQMRGAHLNVLCFNLSKLPLGGLFQYQQDAIVSLAYNIGVTEFVEKSTVYKRLRERNLDLTPWLWYVKDEKLITRAGLVYRRQAELRLFMYGTY